MLAIRMQRTGRRGHAQFRLIVQDSRFSPKSGRVVAYLGSYNPHTKTATLNKEETAKYLQNGARPSDTVAQLIQKEGIKLPQWVKTSAPKKRAIRHPEKLRRNRPASEPAPEPQAKEREVVEQTAEQIDETSEQTVEPTEQQEPPATESETAAKPSEETGAKAEGS